MMKRTLPGSSSAAVSASPTLTSPWIRRTLQTSAANAARPATPATTRGLKAFTEEIVCMIVWPLGQTKSPRYCQNASTAVRT